MKILLIEWACSLPMVKGGVDSPFFAEGKAMLMAVMNDLIQYGHEIVTIARDDFSFDDLSVQIHRVPFGKSLISLLKSLASDCDACVIIAPECGGILFEMVHAIEGTSVRYIGCSSAAVALCADKFQLHKFWTANNVPTPETWVHIDDVPREGAFIIKPLDGAGSQCVRIMKDSQCLKKDLIYDDLIKKERLIIQRLVHGITSSISCLVREDSSIVYMPACGQIIGYQDGCLSYEGGWSPLLKEFQIRSERLAKRALNGIKGILGWVGVDMVLGESSDGSDDFAIEINPRLTTSYIGIRQLIAPSPIPWWINMEDRPVVLKETWPKRLQWDKSGKVIILGVK